MNKIGANIDTLFWTIASKQWAKKCEYVVSPAPSIPEIDRTFENDDFDDFDPFDLDNL